MSAREKLQQEISKGNYGHRIGELMDAVIEVAKEEFSSAPKLIQCEECKPDGCGKIILVDKLGGGAKCIKCGRTVEYPKPKPELIHDYTAEQWQEIIKGKYLCDFTSHEESKFCLEEYSTLREIKDAPFGTKTFESGAFSKWSYCRPAHRKGILRPIFVNPVDKESMCHFFDCEGAWLECGKWDKGVFRQGVRASSYMEI